MKNKKLSLLLLAPLLIVSCSNPTPSTSSSSSSANSSSTSSSVVSSVLSSSSSSINSSSASSSSSSSSEQPVDPDSLLGIITERMAEYNSNKKASKIAEEAGLDYDAPFTVENAATFLYYALKDSMPEVKGIRNYEFPTNPDFPLDGFSSPKAINAIGFFADLGLWGNFTKDQAITLDDLNLIFTRFYRYFGTNKKDDFNTAVNNDFYFSNTDDADWTIDSKERKSTLVNTDNIRKNVIEEIKNQIKNNSENTDSYNKYLDIVEGKSTFDFVTDPSTIEEIKTITSIKSNEDFVNNQIEMFKLFGSSLFIGEPDGSGYYDENKILHPLISVGINTSLQFPLTSLKTAEEFGDYLSDKYKAIGLSEEESYAYGCDYYDFVLKFREWLKYYINNDVLSDQEMIVTDESQFTDEIETSFSILDIAQKSGLTSTAINNMYSVNKYVYCATLKALDECSIKGKIAVSLLNYSEVTYLAQHYHAGQEFNYYDSVYLVSRALADDFEKTELYDTDLLITNNLFNEIKETFSERAHSSSWLSSAGAEAIDDKLSVLKSSSYSYIDGKKVDFSPYYTSLTGNIALDQGNYNYNLWTILSDSLESTNSITAFFNLSMDPFYPNAFYFPADNSMSLTTGFLFAHDYDLTHLSTEELYAEFSFVLGHEITHGFDNNGSKYDKFGKPLADGTIFGKDDQTAYQAKADAIQEKYDKVETFVNLPIKGQNVLGEAMADIGGYGIVKGMASKKADFDYDKFYVDVATHMASKTSYGYYKDRYYTDVHPYSYSRCNILLSNDPEFTEFYDIQPGDGMYVDPSLQVDLW